MEPNIHSGDIVIVKKYAEDDFKVGDIITFEQEGENITHRILNIEEDDLGKKYITKGDNNNIEDLTKITYGEIQGKKVIRIPYIGKIVQILNNEIVFLIIILILLILYFLKIQMDEKKENRREKKKIEEEKRIKN